MNSIKSYLRNVYIIFLSAVYALFFLGGCATQKEKAEIPLLKEKPVASEEPQKAMTTYTIMKGDTLWRISKNYGVSVESIVAANQIKDIRDLKIGQKITIPSNNVSYKSYSNPTVSAMPSQNRVVSSKGFIWPVKGDIVSHFNQTRNGRKFMGISIQPHSRQEIVAAKKGTVEAVSGSDNNFYVVVIKHDGEVRTLYGVHCIPIVSEGNYIEQGQTIATFDPLTKESSTKEIHFKIYVKDTPVNPVSYLP